MLRVAIRRRHCIIPVMSASAPYRGRRAVTIENSDLRLTVLVEGGHIAEIFDKQAGVNPLWTPDWPSIEPSAYDPATDEIYGREAEASLLAGIMGHNLCLDIFGGPSPEEAAAGLPVHGEASSVGYEVQGARGEIVMHARLPLANLEVERRIALHDRAVRIRETVHNPGGTDTPIGWTQHVTLGPPFLEKGSTQFRASAARSRVFESVFGTADYLEAARDFDWPHAPAKRGGTADLRVFTSAETSSAYTAHVMDGRRADAFFVAFSPRLRLAFGYVWRRADFPWMGIWEENASRQSPPWNGRTLTRGMEFGVSPFPESRRQMIERGRLFETPAFRWIPAASRVSVEYWCVSQAAEAIPETLEWPGVLVGH
jgi:hypothetical protein